MKIKRLGIGLKKRLKLTKVIRQISNQYGREKLIRLLYCIYRSGRKRLRVIASAKQREISGVFCLLSALFTFIACPPSKKCLAIAYTRNLLFFSRRFLGMCSENLVETLLSVLSTCLLPQVYVNS